MSGKDAVLEIPTYIGVVLDESTSMVPVADETIKGFNAFLDAQTKAEGSAKIWLTKFSTVAVVSIDGDDIQKASNLSRATYTPNGWTALLDAIGETITRIEGRIAALPAGSVVPRVVIAIITDGEENQSRLWSMDSIKQLITTKTARGWQFTYIGANVDAFKSGASLGINAANVAQYMPGREHAVFAATSNAIGSYRTAPLGAALCAYSAEERTAMAGGTTTAAKIDPAQNQVWSSLVAHVDPKDKADGK